MSMWQEKEVQPLPKPDRNMKSMDIALLYYPSDTLNITSPATPFLQLIGSGKRAEAQDLHDAAFEEQ